MFHFLLGLLVHIMHGPTTEMQMFFVTVGITLGAPVPETTMEFVHGVGVLAVPIHEEVRGGDAILAGIAYVLNVMAMTGMRMVVKPHGGDVRMPNEKVPKPRT